MKVFWRYSFLLLQALLIRVTASHGTRIIREHHSKSTIADGSPHCGNTLTTLPIKPGDKKQFLLERGQTVADNQQTVTQKTRQKVVYRVPEPCKKDVKQPGPVHLFDCKEGHHNDNADWHVLLWRTDENMYFCHGALVHEQWVLTVAHCLVFFDGSYLQPDQILVRFRKPNTKLAVNKVMVHKSFVYSTFKNDIALLKLSEPIRNKHPVCLPKVTDRERLQTLSYRWIEGDIFDEHHSGKLMEHVFNQKKSGNCKDRAVKEAISYHYGDENICSVNPCKGDVWQQMSDGAPVMKTESKTHTLLAVKTWGSSALSCYVGDAVDVHIDVSKYAQWISGVVGGS